MENYLRLLYEDNKYKVYLDKDYTQLKYNNSEERSINARLIVNSKRNHRDYSLLINIIYNKKDQTHFIDYDCTENSTVDIISIKNYLKNNSEFKDILYRELL